MAVVVLRADSLEKIASKIKGFSISSAVDESPLHDWDFGPKSLS
jgi:hypothetical protein